MNQFPPSREAIEMEVLKAVRDYGCGTFWNEEEDQRLSVVKDDIFYRVTYSYKWLTYKYSFSEDQVEGADVVC